MQTFPGFRNPDSLTWGEQQLGVFVGASKGFVDKVGNTRHSLFCGVVFAQCAKQTLLCRHYLQVHVQVVGKDWEPFRRLQLCITLPWWPSK